MGAALAMAQVLGVNAPISTKLLPEIEAVQAYAGGREQRQETLHIRNYSLYTPRDFDVSPFFDIIKPRVRAGFDHRSLRWSKDAGP